MGLAAPAEKDPAGQEGRGARVEKALVHHPADLWDLLHRSLLERNHPTN